MDKKKLISAIIAQLEKELTTAIAAANASREAATNEESQPENEYDTRALEESYLAGAYSKRVADLEEQISVFKHVEAKDFTSNDKITSTALIELEHEGKNQFVFLMSKGGGIHCHFDGKMIQVITPSSPLGETLLGLKEGDFASVEVGDDVKEYEILKVL